MMLKTRMFVTSLCLATLAHWRAFGVLYKFTCNNNIILQNPDETQPVI